MTYLAMASHNNTKNTTTINMGYNNKKSTNMSINMTRNHKTNGDGIASSNEQYKNTTKNKSFKLQQPTIPNP